MSAFSRFMLQQFHLGRSVMYFLRSAISFILHVHCRYTAHSTDLCRYSILSNVSCHYCPPTRVAKVMFLVMSVCLSVYPWRVLMWPPPGPFQTCSLGDPPTIPGIKPQLYFLFNLDHTTQGPAPYPWHVQTYWLCDPYCRQVGSCYSTEMTSCVSAC